MAIEAISNPKLAYQGSVPGADVSLANTEKVTENYMTEESSNEKSEGTVFTAIQDADSTKDMINTTVSPGTEAMKKAVEEINRNARNSEAVFGIHDATNRVTIKIIDKDTKKVLKEYPPEKTLDMIAKVWEMAGLMVDEKR